MSKSLKNFISIRELLEMNNMTQVRILFLLQEWDGKINYSQDTIAEANAKERTFREYFLLVRALERQSTENFNDFCTSDQAWDESDISLNTAIVDTQTAVDAAMRNNFNYPEAVRVLTNLVTTANNYVKFKRSKSEFPKVLLLKKASDYVNRILTVLGVVKDGEPHFLGSAIVEREKTIGPHLDRISQFRDGIRRSLLADKVDFSEISASAAEFKKSIGIVDGNEGDETLTWLALMGAFVDEVEVALKKGGEEKATKQSLRELCDKLRDIHLPPLGVKIEDPQSDELVKGGQSLWKLYDPEYLANTKAQMKKSTEKPKLIKQLAGKQRELDRMEKFSVAPSEYFKDAEKFSQYSDEGIPTHDKAGEALTKSQAKKMAKEYKKYKSSWDKLQKSEAANPGCGIDKLRAEIEELTEKLKNL